MTDVLQGLHDAFMQPEGQWWFAANDPIDFEPSTVEPDPQCEEEDQDPVRAPHGSDLPKCRICKDPNFSMNDDRCITCRMLCLD